MFIIVTQCSIKPEDQQPFLLNMSKVDAVHSISATETIGSRCLARDGTEWTVMESLEEIQQLCREERVAELQTFRKHNVKVGPADQLHNTQIPYETK